MAEFPIMPMCWDAYLADTTHFTTLEHGAYLLLLAAMWRAGGTLPDDERQLARFAKLTSGQWRRASVAIWPKLRRGNGYITQNKLLETLEAVRQRSQKSQNSARARWLKVKGLPHALASNWHMLGDANQIKKERKKRGDEVLSLEAGNPRSKEARKEDPPKSPAAPPILVSAALAAKYTTPRRSDDGFAHDLEIPAILRRSA